MMDGTLKKQIGWLVANEMCKTYSFHYTKIE